MSSCASYVSRTHDVIDDVTRSQNRSNFEIDISPSIFDLEHRSKAQNVRNAHGYIPGIFNFRYNFRQKVCRELKMAAILKILKYLTQLQSDLRYEKIVPNFAKKMYFHDDDVINDVTGWPFWKFWNIKHNFHLTSDMKRSSQIMQKKISWWWRHRWRHRLASKFSSIFMFRRAWLREQVVRAMSRQ